MSQPAILVLGSINTDLVVKGPRIPTPGETVVGGRFFKAAGGKGANQAVAAARAGGVSVNLIAAVGDDEFGRAALEGLKAEGVACEHVKQIDAEPSGVALIMVDDNGQNCISVASGANLHLTPADIDALDDQVFQQATVLLACLETPWQTVLRGLERAKHFGLTTILNPAPATSRIASSDALKHVDIITPNEPEATLLVGETIYDIPSAIKAGKRLVQRGCRQAIVTLGSRGCVVVNDKVTHVDALKVRAVDTTAAGDAFNGTLALALAEGKDIEMAARWANIAASLSVTRQGAQPSLPSREEIDGKLAEIAAATPPSTQ